MHPVLPVRLQQCRAQRDNPFPHPAGNVELNAPQGTVVFPGFLGTLLTHAQFAVDQDPQPLLVGVHSSVPTPGSVYVQGCSFPGAESGPCSCYTSCSWCLPSTTSLCKTSPTPVVTTAPPSSTSSSNLLKTPSSPASHKRRGRSFSVLHLLHMLELKVLPS